MASGICRGFVLTGGMSTRMGQDKALMEVRGRPLVLHVADAVQDAVHSVTLVGSMEKYGTLCLPVLEDREPGHGPLSGIHAALKDTRTPLNLVVGCDMPFLHADFLQFLVQVAMVADAQVTVAESLEFGFEALCAVYNRDILPAVEQAMIAGERKLSRLYEGLRVRSVSPDECRPYNPHGFLFHNVNTPEDFEQARLRLEMIARGAG